MQSGAILVQVLLALLACLHVLPSLVRGDATSPECRAEMQKCSAGQPCPDLVLDGPRAQASAYVTTETFTASSCAVLEGCTKPGTRKLLRFDMATGNIGTKELPIGNPGAPSLQPCFIWSSCHNHFHFSAFGSYALRDASSNVVAVGAKAAACVQDAFRWAGSDAPIVPTSQWFGCSNQGIHAGYQDVYGAHLDCQWVDVTGVPAGTYHLELSVNVERVLAESNYDNNLVSFPVVIPADAGTQPPPSTDPTGCSTQGGCQSCTSAAGGQCGWCSSAGYCAYGSYLGPSSGSCREWTWGNGQCTSTNPTVTCPTKTTCQSCAATANCGWCPSTNQCTEGTPSGPSVGSCPQLWQYGASNTCGNCPSHTNCGDCARSTGCGWCASSNTCSGGTWQGPSGSTCANWVWSAAVCASLPPYTPPSTAAACTASTLTRTGQTTVGTCPSGSNTLASGSSCQLECNTGYTRSSGGLASCNNGAWTVTQPNCLSNTATSCTLPSPAPAGTNGGCTTGGTLASGSSCTYTVASEWSLQSGSLTRTCSAGAFTTAAPVLTQSTGTSVCPTKTSCQSCAATTGCGWCPNTNKCTAGTLTGPSSGTCPQLWQFGASNMCGKCESLSNCGDCAGATGCGWCGASSKCFGGTWLGPSGTTCASNSWTWSAASCSAPPASAAAVCTPALDCTSCSNLRGCGWCSATSTCSAGQWTGPSSGTCPTWVWSAPNCQATSVTQVANAALTVSKVSRMAQIGSSPAAAAAISRVAVPSGLEDMGVAPSDSSVLGGVSFSLYPPDQVSLLSSLHPGVDPEAFLIGASLSLDELLKADAAGNALKHQSDISAGLKSEPDGNFLKLRTDIDLSRVERPVNHAAATSLSRSSESDASSVADVKPAPVASAWDPEPDNPLLPHGHYEHHEHLAVGDLPATVDQEGANGSGNSSGGASSTAAANLATSLLVSTLLICLLMARI